MRILSPQRVVERMKFVVLVTGENDGFRPHLKTKRHMQRFHVRIMWSTRATASMTFTSPGLDNSWT